MHNPVLVHVHVNIFSGVIMHSSTCVDTHHMTLNTWCENHCCHISESCSAFDIALCHTFTPFPKTHLLTCHTLPLISLLFFVWFDLKWRLWFSLSQHWAELVLRRRLNLKLFWLCFCQQECFYYINYCV